MSITKITNNMTEAELEARLREVLKVIFPWIKSEEIKHQTTFKFKFGTSYVEVKGKKVSEAQGRLDILIYRNDQPLAVVELKRPSVQLTTEDESQGLSYARMHNPMPPLVIVSNGKDSKVLITYTGEQWQPNSISELELEKKINAMGDLALGELNNAIGILLGPNSDFWVEIVKTTSKVSISEQLGYLNDKNYTFTKDFLIPRDATDQLLKCIENSKKITIIHGSPLIGKSNVLFDFINRTEASNNYAVLYVEADSGEGICQYIASLFSAELEIKFSRDDVLLWLKKLSNSQGKKLVLAVDGVGYEKCDVQKDIEVLAKSQYGSNLKIIITCDDVIAEKLIKKGNKPKPSSLGRCAQQIHVDKLSNIEFNEVQKLLSVKGLRFMDGADRSPEYRLPHIIKAVLNSTPIDSISNQNKSLLVLPSLLGPNLLVECRKIYEDTHSYRDLYQDIVKVIITEYLDKSRSSSLILNSMYTFSIRRKKFLLSFDHSLLNDLIENELIKTGYTLNNESILIITLPELFASEVAYYLSRQLIEKVSTSPIEVYSYLLTNTAALPFGDLIAALAICDVEELKGLPIEFYEELLSDKPKYYYPQPGTKMALMLPTPKGKVEGEITIKDENHALIEVGNTQELIEMEDLKGELRTIGNQECWLILSHLANNQKLLNKLVKSGIDILTEVGNCSMMLRKYSENIEDNGYEFHELEDGSSASCSRNGIVEPITLAIFSFFGNSNIQAKEWLKSIDLKQAIHLKLRVWTVLSLLSDCSNENISNWAREELGSLY